MAFIWRRVSFPPFYSPVQENWSLLFLQIRAMSDVRQSERSRCRYLVLLRNSIGFATLFERGTAITDLSREIINGEQLSLQPFLLKKILPTPIAQKGKLLQQVGAHMSVTMEFLKEMIQNHREMIQHGVLLGGESYPFYTWRQNRHGIAETIGYESGGVRVPFLSKQQTAKFLVSFVTRIVSLRYLTQYN